MYNGAAAEMPATALVVVTGPEGRGQANAANGMGGTRRHEGPFACETLPADRRSCVRGARPVFSLRPSALPEPGIPRELDHPCRDAVHHRRSAPAHSAHGV